MAWQFWWSRRWRHFFEQSLCIRGKRAGATPHGPTEQGGGWAGEATHQIVVLSGGFEGQMILQWRLAVGGQSGREGVAAPAVVLES